MVGISVGYDVVGEIVGSIDGSCDGYAGFGLEEGRNVSTII